MAYDPDRFISEFLEAKAAHGFSSYRQIAEAVGGDHTVWTNILRHRKRPSAQLLMAWADAIKEPRSKWLILGGYEEFVCEHPPPYALKRVEIEGAELWIPENSKLSDEAIKRIAEIARVDQAEISGQHGKNSRAERRTA